MHYLSVDKISKSYGITGLFSNLSFHVNQGDKIALIARNGVGKSSLLKILAGKDVPDEGKVWVNKDVSITLFEQDNKFDETKSVIDNIFDLPHPILNAIKFYEAAVDSNDAAKISEAITKMDELQAWKFEANVKEILTKLNIHHLQQAVQWLSGGQKRRIALAKCLIEIGFEHQHALLLMDEPTNHLDVQMIEWLEQYLNQQNITLILVTHDRYFLEAVADEIWELEKEKLYIYKGDYDQYLEKKAQRIESEQATIDKAKNEYRKELEWMRKQPKARTTKSKSREDNFYEIEKKAKQIISDNQVQLQLKMSRLGGKILELKKLYKKYDETIILNGFDYTFSKAERIGIVGKNGVGKSTFLNIIQQIDKPDSGKINVGDTVVFGNFAQSGLTYKTNVRVIEYVKNIAESFPLAKGGSLSAAQFLELFLFTPDKQYTYIESLSGGEKKRLQLLSVLFQNPNFLILDEPTNDLDLPTLQVLENFLLDFQGCLIIVSHDRYFMDKLVDHLFVFEGDGVIKDFPGNYSTYRFEQIKQQQQQVKAAEKPKATQARTGFGPYKKEIEKAERDLKKLEEKKQEIEAKLLASSTDYNELFNLGKELDDIKMQIEEKEMQWLELNEKNEAG